MARTHVVIRVVSSDNVTHFLAGIISLALAVARPCWISWRAANVFCFSIPEATEEPGMRFPELWNLVVLCTCRCNVNCRLFMNSVAKFIGRADLDFLSSAVRGPLLSDLKRHYR